MRSRSRPAKRGLRLRFVLRIPAFVATLSAAYGQRLPGDALRDAVSSGHRLGSEDLGVQAVKRLLDAGVPVNSQDGIGWSALMRRREAFRQRCNERKWEHRFVWHRS